MLALALHVGAQSLESAFPVLGLAPGLLKPADQVQAIHRREPTFDLREFKAGGDEDGMPDANLEGQPFPIAVPFGVRVLFPTCIAKEGLLHNAREHGRHRHDRADAIHGQGIAKVMRLHFGDIGGAHWALQRRIEVEGVKHSHGIYFWGGSADSEGESADELRVVGIGRGVTLGAMSTALEIENAVSSLPQEEFWKLAEWFDARKADAWDAQIEVDAAAGKLDFL
jgi:hypothetical protein